jgi:hypothetical protein
MATTFVFPPLKLKKTDIQPLSFERMCFQVSLNKADQCILVGYKMNASRAMKSGSQLIRLSVDNSSEEEVVKINGNVLFVQLELSVADLSLAVSGGTDTHLRFTPEKNAIGSYSYVTYHIATSTATGDIETTPCPPAIPPGGEG